MIKRSNTLLLFFISIAIFAIISFAPKAIAEEITQANPGEQGSSVHICTKQTNNDWICKYDGEEYKFEVDEEGKQEAGFLGKCTPLAQRLHDLSGCLFCPLFLALFNAVQDMASKSFEALALFTKIAMSVGFAMWIAITTLPIVSSITKQDAPKYIKNLLIQTFKVGICFLLLENPRELYYWVIDTILIAAMDFSNSFLFNVDTSNIDPTFTPAEFNKGVIGSGVITALDRLLQAMQLEIGFLMSMGSSTLCVGIKSLNIGMFLNGVIVYFLSVVLLISFGFYLADAVIQLGIIGALMPFLIATYPFKVTSKWAKQGFGILMNTFFTFLILGVVISIDIALILQAIVSGSTDGIGDPKAALFTAFSNNDNVAINNFFDIGAAGGVGLIACIILAFKFTEQASTIADKYSGGGLVKGISNKIGGMAASGVTNTAKKVAKPAAKAVSKKVTDYGKQKLGQAKKGVGNMARGASQAFSKTQFAKDVNALGSEIKNSKVGKIATATAKGAESVAKFVTDMPVNATVGAIKGGQAIGGGLSQGLNYAANKAADTKVGQAAIGAGQKAVQAKDAVRSFMGLDTQKSRQEAINTKLNAGGSDE